MPGRDLLLVVGGWGQKCMWALGGVGCRPQTMASPFSPQVREGFYRGEPGRLNKDGGLKEDTLVAFGHEGDKTESS